MPSPQNDSQSWNYKKLRNKLVTKIVSSDPDNDWNLEALMNLDILEVFKKYEEININSKIKNESTTEDLNNVKSKLKIQLEQRDLYEKEFIKIMKAVNINPNEGSYVDILPAINDQKRSLEQNEEEHYTNSVDKLNVRNLN